MLKKILVLNNQYRCETSIIIKILADKLYFVIFEIPKTTILMNHRPKIKLSKGIHNDQAVIFIKFAYDVDLIKEVKVFPGSRWSMSKRCWYIPDTGNNMFEIEKHLKIEKKESLVQHSLKQATKAHYLESNKKPFTIKADSVTGRIYISFPYDLQIKEAIKRLDGSWWHVEAKRWSVLLTMENISRLEELFKGKDAIWDDSSVKSIKRHRPSIKKGVVKIDPSFEKQLKIENKSKNTIANYISQVSHFLYYFKDEEIVYLSETKIRDYIHLLRDGRKYSASFQRIFISAINNYYRIVYKRDLDRTELPYPIFEKRLPKVISKEDVQKMIDTTINNKHKMTIIMLYSLGLRNNELSLLRRRDIDFDREIITIYNAKGRKDRQIPLPKSIREPMKKYMKDYAIRDYFLEGQNGKPYSGSSIGKVVKNAAEKVKVKLAVTPHVLRHCFATHSLEKGVDLRYIQAMLGHSSSKTTEIYTHVSTNRLKSLPNPLDDIKI